MRNYYVLYEPSKRWPTSKANDHIKCVYVISTDKSFIEKVVKTCAIKVHLSTSEGGCYMKPLENAQLEEWNEKQVEQYLYDYYYDLVHGEGERCPRIYGSSRTKEQLGVLNLEKVINFPEIYKLTEEKQGVRNGVPICLADSYIIHTITNKPSKPTPK